MYSDILPLLAAELCCLTELGIVIGKFEHQRRSKRLLLQHRTKFEFSLFYAVTVKFIYGESTVSSDLYFPNYGDGNDKRGPFSGYLHDNENQV